MEQRWCHIRTRRRVNGGTDKLTGHVVVPAEFDDIGSEEDRVDGLILVCKDYYYNKLNRKQELCCDGESPVKIDGVGYFYTYFSKKYDDTNWKQQTTNQEIGYRYGQLMKGGVFNWSIICTADKAMTPIADVTNCKIVKCLKK